MRSKAGNLKRSKKIFVVVARPHRGGSKGIHKLTLGMRNGTHEASLKYEDMKGLCSQRAVINEL
jgi:hypothetical protein